MSSRVEHASAPATRYDVVTAVWGDEFVTLFLDFCIPNQLSPGNLAALPPGSRYRIFTTASDARRLKSSSRLDEVRQLLPVDIVELDLAEADAYTKRPSNTHKRMIACHRRAAADAAGEERALIYLAPDFVLGEGTIAGLVRIHSAGSRAVLTANLRLMRAEFVGAHTALGTRALAPRELVRLAMRHLHPWTRSLVADAASTSDNPTSVYWPVLSGEAIEGLLVRTFYLHPMLVDPVVRTAMPGGPIDSHYVRDCCPNVADCHVVDDSDELIVFELSPTARLISNERSGLGVSPLRLAGVAALCNGHQLSHWQSAIRLHSGDFDQRWTAAARDSSALARRVERYRPFGSLVVTAFSLLKWSRQRRAAYGRTYRQWRGRAQDIRRELQRWTADVSDLRKVFRPPVTSKQISRPAKLFMHRAAKKSKTGLKQIRRRVGLL